MEVLGFSFSMPLDNCFRNILFVAKTYYFLNVENCIKDTIFRSVERLQFTNDT